MLSLQSLSKEALEHSIQTRPLVLQQMGSYMDRLGLVVSRPVLHVAGTKGKGSTAAFLESIMRQCGLRTGMYTSPHLIEMRERFRVNSQPVPEAVFLKHLHETYDDLVATASECGDHPVLPSYFRFLTLVAFRMFEAEDVDVLVLETGMGGRLDATNIVEEPLAVGITLIDYDHMDVLGNTLREIATEKGGIIKSGVAAFTVEQPEEALEALHACAAEAGVQLAVVPALPRGVDGGDVVLGLDGDHQYQNAALAVAMAKAFCVKAVDKLPKLAALIRDESALEEAIRMGIALCQWPGRCQVMHYKESGVTFFLDGAHTPHSVGMCAKWFADKLAQDCGDGDSDDDSDGGGGGGDGDGARAEEKRRQRQQRRRVVLLFNCSHTRDPFVLLEPLAALNVFDAVVCCPFDQDRPRLNPPPGLQAVAKEAGRDISEAQVRAAFDAVSAGSSSSSDSSASTSWQYTLLQVYSLLAGHGSADLSLQYAPTAAGVVDGFFQSSKEQEQELHTHVLVTGSLYLVGNCLSALEKYGASPE